MSKRLLIIEDDEHLGQMLGLHFEDQGFSVQHVTDCAAARAQLDRPFDLALMDQQLPDGLGIELLPQIIAAQPGLPVIMMTGHHDLELAIQAIRDGAADFVHKPIKTDELQRSVDRVLETRRLDQQFDGQAEQPPAASLSRELIGRSDAMLAVSKEIALSARSLAPVLISGESGTGKELVARLIHQYSDRADGPFVAVNCAAIVDSLLESELFGHEKGAFTGADEAKPGKFLLAQDGTLFLDEIGELAPPLQAKLLRALQEQVIEPVGATQPLPINARVISATNRDLFEMAGQRQFREDLIYRLNVVTIALPALRERTEDIPLLAQRLTELAARALGKPTPQLPSESLARLQSHHWPGNVRELNNVLTQALIHARGNILTPDLLKFGGEAGSSVPASAAPREGDVLRTLDEVEAEHIQRVLDHCAGHKANSCKILGISRPALDRKIGKYGLRVSKT